MSNKIFATLAILVLSYGSAAMASPFPSQSYSRIAVTPILSGTYNMTIRTYCQPTLTADVSDDSVIDALTNSPDPGNAFFQEMVAAKFNPKTGKLSFTGFQDEASVFRLKFTGQTNNHIQGGALAERATSGSGAYSNTATTFTGGGDGTTYNALYGELDKNGIAHTISFMGITAGNGGTTCSTQGEATRQ